MLEFDECDHGAGDGETMKAVDRTLSNIKLYQSIVAITANLTILASCLPAETESKQTRPTTFATVIEGNEIPEYPKATRTAQPSPPTLNSESWTPPIWPTHAPTLPVVVPTQTLPGDSQQNSPAIPSPSAPPLQTPNDENLAQQPPATVTPDVGVLVIYTHIAGQIAPRTYIPGVACTEVFDHTELRTDRVLYTTEDFYSKVVNKVSCPLIKINNWSYECNYGRSGCKPWEKYPRCTGLRQAYLCQVEPGS